MKTKQQLARDLAARKKGRELVDEAIEAYCVRVGIPVPAFASGVDPVWRAALWWDLKYRASMTIAGIARKFNTSASFVMSELERVSREIQAARGGDLDTFRALIMLGLEDWLPQDVITLAGGRLAEIRLEEARKLAGQS